jgi:hypothetical protein
MNFENPFLLAIIGVAVVSLGYWVVTHFFSAEAKQERRRRRSNARISSTARHPTVRLSVRPPKKKG